MQKLFIITLFFLIFISCDDSVTTEKTKFNLIDFELIYKHYSLLSSDFEINDTIFCRVVGDTTISGIDVYKYRFITVSGDSSDTTMNYMQITDTSIINYAYWGYEPNIFLSRNQRNTDSVTLEDSPYSVILSPYKDSVSWYTRPEETDLFSIKTYTTEDTIEVGAGAFNCAKVTTDILPSLFIEDLWAEQWWHNLVLIKSYISFGKVESKDNEGNVISSIDAYETFELIGYSEH